MEGHPLAMALGNCGSVGDIRCSNEGEISI